MKQPPHLPAEDWRVEWQFVGGQVHARSFVSLARSDAFLYDLLRRNPQARVWQCGNVMQQGQGFAEPARQRKP